MKKWAWCQVKSHVVLRRSLCRNYTVKILFPFQGSYRVASLLQSHLLGPLSALNRISISLFWTCAQSCESFSQSANSRPKTTKRRNKKKTHKKSLQSSIDDTDQSIGREENTDIASPTEKKTEGVDLFIHAPQ